MSSELISTNKMRAVNYSLVTNQRFYPPPHHTGRDGRVYDPSKNVALHVEQQKFKSSHNCSNHLSRDGKIPSFKTTSGRRLKSGLDEAARANFSQQRAVNAASGPERGRNCQFVGLFFLLCTRLCFATLTKAQTNHTECYWAGSNVAGVKTPLYFPS